MNRQSTAAADSPITFEQLETGALKMELRQAMLSGSVDRTLDAIARQASAPCLRITALICQVRASALEWRRRAAWAQEMLPARRDLEQRDRAIRSGMSTDTRIVLALGREPGPSDRTASFGAAASDLQLAVQRASDVAALVPAAEDLVGLYFAGEVEKVSRKLGDIANKLESFEQAWNTLVFQEEANGKPITLPESAE